MDYPIRPVCGNWTRFIHPLEKVVWQDSQKTIVDYVPQEGDKLTVTLQGAYKPYTMENVTIEGNVLKYENNGTLPCGVYDIVINVVLADGKRLRSHQDCIVKVVKTNKEASIPDYVEFGVDTYELDGAVFMYVPNGEGESGEDGVGIDSITTVESPDDGGNNVVTIHLTDGTESSFNVKNGHKGSDGAQGNQGLSAYEVYCSTVPEGQQPMSLNEWLASLIGKSAYQVYYDAAVSQGLTPMSQNEWIASLKGERGIGIANITEQASPDSGGTNTVTVTMDDDVQNPTTYELQVKNGEKGDGGDSAYQTYLDTLEEGETALTPRQWIESLKGEKGDTGPQGDTLVVDGTDTYKLYHELGQNNDGAVDQKVLTDALNNIGVPVTSEQVAEMADPS